MKFKSYLIRCATIACCLALLGHFITLLIYKSITIQEPNLAILLPEVVGLSLIIIFACLNLARDARG